MLRWAEAGRGAQRAVEMDEVTSCTALCAVWPSTFACTDDCHQLCTPLDPHLGQRLFLDPVA